MTSPNTTTPIGSPVPVQKATFAIAEGQGLGIEGASLQDEPEPPALRAVESVQALDKIDEEGPRVSLPARIEPEEDTADLDSLSNGEPQRVEVVVEKDQASLAFALDREASAATTAKSQGTVPRINVPRHKDQQPVVEEDFDSLFAVPQQQKVCSSPRTLHFCL